jgi:hypothetical protein
MLDKYQVFEARRRKKKHRPKRNRGGGGGVDAWLQQQKTTSIRQHQKGITPKTETQSRGMNMIFSERLKYVLNKIALKGNRLAKELLTLPAKPEAKFEYSYIDLTSREDTMSYLPYTGKDLPEDEKFKSNKRQHAKVYKTIKTLFGSKYTKTEVNKFVSIYKQIYNEGPGKDTDRPKPSEEQVIKKITEDTKSDKLEWKLQGRQFDWLRYDADIKITEKKKLVFQLFIFPRITEETNSFLIVSMHNDLGITKEEKRKWIQTLKFGSIIEFLKVFKDKYLKEEEVVY